jgi:hypothetical protein
MTLKTIQPPAKDVTNLFSRMRFKIWRVIDSSSGSDSAAMDRFLKKRVQKINGGFTELGPCVCVLGKTGIGKTWSVRTAFGGNYVELTPDILKSKQGTIDMLERLASSDTPVVLDEFEAVCDLVGIREITGPPSRGQFVIVSQIPIDSKFDFKIQTYMHPVPTPADLRRIVPNASDDLIEKSGGDIRYVLRGMTFKSDDPDAFMTTREFVASLVSKNSDKSPLSYIGYSSHEPGNMVAIIQENYPDARGVNIAEVANHISEAEMFETKMYEGDWHLMPYYTLAGCIAPAVAIGHRLNPDKIRPGSSWTKHQNICMRQKKLRAICDRVPEKHLDYDTLMLLRRMGEAGQYDILREYKLEPKDIDILNHLSPLNKLKPKTVQAMKKALTPP